MLCWTAYFCVFVYDSDKHIEMYQNKKKYYTYCFSTAKLVTFGQEDNIFSICSSTGEFLVDFLWGIITASFFLASFSEC